MNFRYCLTVSLFLVLSRFVFGQNSSPPAFTVVPLGVKGGLDESNLSAYMLAPHGTQAYVCLDAGTLYTGIRRAIENQAFTVGADVVLKEYIKAYLLSHAHLDHLAGLVTNSPDDAKKNIYALPACLDILQKHYFNWESWPNMGNAGSQPLLKKYTYQALPLEKEVSIEQTSLSVQTFPLSHGNPYESAAFLVRNGQQYALYLGDTGADAVEKRSNLALLWQAIAPLLRTKALRVIFMEVSYPNEQPDQLLFGHLTPYWLMHEMQNLDKLAGQGALKGLPLVVTHIKPTSNDEARIKQQLAEANTLGLKLIFPEQGKLLEF